MATLQQLKRKKRVRWSYKDKRKALMKCPQRKGICLRVYSMTPRKPNSAIRKVARVLLSNWNRVTAYLPGEGMNSLQQHSVVLVRGGRIKDLPGVKYTMIRGKYDLRRLQKRGEKRSKYGVHCFIHSKYKRI